MELQTGQIVASRRGRDVTRWYMVVGFDKDRVLVADGGKRTLAAPKPKNPHHLAPTNTVLPPGAADTDQKLKTALAAYAERSGAQTLTHEQGG